MQVFETFPSLKDLLKVNPALKYILWDMDGTIMKTEPFHTKATCELIKHYNPSAKFSYEEIDHISLGVTDETCLKKLIEQKFLSPISLEEFIKTKDHFFEQVLQKTSPEQICAIEIQKLIASANEQGIKQAIVTSSEKALTLLLLDFLNISHKFSFILTREDTAKNKPDPLPYLTAMKKFDAKREECLILEDSPSGLAAAKASQIEYIQAKWYY